MMKTTINMQEMLIDGKMNFVDVSTLHMYQSDSKVYICTTNDQAYGNIQSIIYTCFVIIAVAIILPGVIIHFFADYFTNRILSLRQAMHQVSNEDLYRPLQQYQTSSVGFLYILSHAVSSQQMVS